jgi:hypothetical protein
MNTRNYNYTANGRIYYISQGLGHGDPNAKWFTLWRKADGKGGAHRVVSKNLPLRDTATEAQADLDAYAEKKGWQVH